jgi:hypothetical protein
VLINPGAINRARYAIAVGIGIAMHVGQCAESYYMAWPGAYIIAKEKSSMFSRYDRLVIVLCARKHWIKRIKRRQL